MELEDTHPDAVLYATPAIHKLARFNAAYQAADVPRESFLFSPREIGPLPDNLPHSVAYHEGLDYGWFCSKMPREVRAVRLESMERSWPICFRTRATRHCLPQSPTRAMRSRRFCLAASDSLSMPSGAVFAPEGSRAPIPARSTVARLR